MNGKGHDNATMMLMNSVLEMDGAENPHNWPLLKKIHASAAGWAMTFAVYLHSHSLSVILSNNAPEVLGSPVTQQLSLRCKLLWIFP